MLNRFYERRCDYVTFASTGGRNRRLMRSRKLQIFEAGSHSQNSPLGTSSRVGERRLPRARKARVSALRLRRHSYPYIRAHRAAANSLGGVPLLDRRGHVRRKARTEHAQERIELRPRQRFGPPVCGRRRERAHRPVPSAIIPNRTILDLERRSLERLQPVAPAP